MAKIDHEALKIMELVSAGEQSFLNDMQEVEARPDLLGKYADVIEQMGTALGEIAGSHGSDGLDWFVKAFRLALAAAIASTKVTQDASRN